MSSHTIIKKLKGYLKEFLYSVFIRSLESAAREQGLEELSRPLRKLVPDISNQYTIAKIDNPYLEKKVRNLHAFQLSLVNEVLKKFEKAVIVDIGDSSGTHVQYIMGLHSNKDIKCVSVNLDPKAVDKIKRKGLTAINARAEDLHKYNVNCDIFLCFETLEHLMDPYHFLYNLSSNTNAKFMIVTVPYVKNSRVGLDHIRGGKKERVFAENTHIFELSPQDWNLVVRHSGWEIVKERIYLQYPKKSFLGITKFLWKWLDFEGFYGLILKRDNTWSSRYADW